jgi:hypothetical protein
MCIPDLLDGAAVLLARHRPDQHLVRRDQLSQRRVRRDPIQEVAAHRQHHRDPLRLGRGIHEPIDEPAALALAVAEREHLLELIDGQDQAPLGRGGVEAGRVELLQRMSARAEHVRRPPRTARQNPGPKGGQQARQQEG